MKTNFALGIEVNLPIPPGGSLFARNEQKDCKVKPDPQGNAQKSIKVIQPKLDPQGNAQKSIKMIENDWD